MMKKTREEYLNIKEDCLGAKYEFVFNSEEKCYAPIGKGGSGIVYAANQIFSDDRSIHTKRAIKFFIYKEELVDELGYVSNDNFDIEIENITRFNHQNILKVIDGNYYTVKINGEDIKIPYTVTEYIDGLNLEEIFELNNIETLKKVIKNEESIFILFSQIIDGIEYLHTNNFYHCDIAPKNIFLKLDNDKDFFVVIGDIGAGRTVLPKKFNHTKIIGTRKYMPRNVQGLKDTLVAYEKFCELQPKWDIYSTVVTLKEIIEKAKANGIFGQDAWNLERFFEKLQENEYNTIEDIKRDIYNLRPSSNQILKLDELSEASKNIGQVLLPINSAYLSRRMRKLSKHDIMLRLMDVPQLLEGAITYPGANHTRYEHSLGTYELMRKAMLSLLRNKQYAKFLSDRYVIIGLISALLSSLVNFPYSYVINELRSQDDDLFDELNTEKVFDYLINIESSVTKKSLLNYIGDYFGEYRITIDELKYVIFGKGKRKGNKELEVLHSILNSSIGVRVIDYMMRDSHHIGLTNKINTEDLFKSMYIHNGEFCIKQTGIISAEQIISNRYWLFKRIYWSEPNRAHAALLKHLFYMVSSEAFSANLISKLHIATKKDIQNTILEYSSSENKKNMEHAILHINQKGQTRYKSILVLDKNSKHPNANEICSRFSKLKYSQQHYIRDQIEKMFIDEFVIPKPIIENGPILLIDMPYEKSGNKLGNDIRVIRHDKSYLQLINASGIVTGLKTSFEDQLMLLRVFLRPDIYTYLKENKDIGKNEVERFLTDKLYDFA